MRGSGLRARIAGNIALALLLLSGGIVMLAALQRQLIYYPQVEPEAALLHSAEQIGLRDWRNSSGELIGWRSASASGTGRRLVVFHGNAGHALHRQYFAAGFHALASDWQVYLFEYPGYGARPGSPSEATIKAAALAALQELLQQDARPVYLLGESLGSGVASYLAGELQEQVAGILLVTPFTSLTDVARRHYGFLPVGTLLRERYDSEQALAGYRGPAAFLVAGDDEIVPAELGRALHEGYRGPKWLQEQPGAGHNSLNLGPRAAWWRELEAFWLAD